MMAVRITVGWLLVLLAAFAGEGRAQPPAGAPPAVEPVDLQVLVIARSGGPDVVAVSYGQPVADAQVHEDYQNLARALNHARVTPAIKHSPATDQLPASVEAQAILSGLVNWQAGQLNLDALLQTFKRYRRVNVVFWFETPFDLRWPRGGGTRGPLRWQLDSADRHTAKYDFWIDQSHGVPRDLPSLRPGGVPWGMLIGLGGIALVTGIGVFWVTHRLMRQRAIVPSSGESSDGV